MRVAFGMFAVGLALVSVAPAWSERTNAIAEPREVANPPMSWVCLNPRTRQYQALKAASLLEARQVVGGDNSTRCEEIPVALDPERVAYELNTEQLAPRQSR